MKSRYLLIYLSALVCFLASCSRQNETFEPKSIEDLYGHSLALMEGGHPYNHIVTNYKDADIKLNIFPTLTDCFLSVATGKSDATLLSDITAIGFDLESLGVKIISTIDEYQAPFGFGVKEGNKELQSQFNEFIDAKKASGEIEEIIMRWVLNETGDFNDCVRIEPIPSEPTGTGPILTIGTSGVEPPASVLLDNKWTGFETELLQLFAAEYGYQLRFKPFAFSNLIPSIQSGMIDVIASTLLYTEERDQKVDYTHFTWDAKGVLVVKNHESQKSETFWDSVKKSAHTSLIAENRWKLIVNGLWTTIIITILSLIFGACLGSGICWMKMHRRNWVRKTASFYQYLMKNTPMLVLLMIMFYVVLANTGLSPVTIAIVAFSMNTSAFMSEIFRTGIMSVDNGQKEAGRGLGCTPFQTFRYIILPQAVRTIIPVFKNECVTLLKGTAVVGYISIIDLTKGSDLIRSSTFEAFFPLIVITVVYFILATLLTFGIKKLTEILF